MSHETGWVQLLGQFFREFGFPGIAILAMAGCVCAVIWLVKYNQAHVAALHTDNKDILGQQTTVLIKAVEGLAGQTEVLRTVKDELRGIGESVREFDRSRGRDVERIVDAITRGTRHDG